MKFKSYIFSSLNGFMVLVLPWVVLVLMLMVTVCGLLGWAMMVTSLIVNVRLGTEKQWMAFALFFIVIIACARSIYLINEPRDALDLLGVLIVGVSYLCSFVLNVQSLIAFLRNHPKADQ